MTLLTYRLWAVFRSLSNPFQPVTHNHRFLSMNPSIWSQDLIHPWQHGLHTLLDWPGGTVHGIGCFIQFFPLLLSLSWSVSALLRLGVVIFKTWFGRKVTTTLPTFSVLIPFYGDAQEALRSVHSLRYLKPAPQEIVMIDDGSPAGCELLADFALPANVRLLRLPQNIGKAAALNCALHSVTSDIVVCLDADTTARTTDWSPMLAQFIARKELGAITGKIRPKRISNLVQLMQAIDYLAVICMVKCAESLWGGLTTVSGAWVAYRRQALVECGGWNAATSAEDIDLSWRLQSSGWRLDYDFNWTANVEMALHWKSLWRQRRRWSSGMARTLRGQCLGVFRSGARHTAVSLLAVLGSLWIVSSLGLGVFTLGQAALGHPGFGWLTEYKSLISLGAAAFALQLLVGIAIDRSSWHRYPLMLLLAPAYPIYFWGVLFTSNISGLIHGFFYQDGGRWQPTSVLDAARPLPAETIPARQAGQLDAAISICVPAGRPFGKSRHQVRPCVSQVIRLLVLGWSGICLYSGLVIALKVPSSLGASGMMITQLSIGVITWMLGCWQFPECLSLGAKTRVALSILIFTVLNVVISHHRLPVRWFVGDVVTHEQAVRPYQAFFSTLNS